MINTLITYFSYPFVRYAFIVAVLVSFCAALLGVILVLKRFSFLGDGLSHFAFGAVAISAVIGLTDNMMLVMPVTIICAVLLLRAGQNAGVKGDASLAMVSVSSLAVGYLLLNVFSASTNVAGDVCSSLFGSEAILTLNIGDVVRCIVISAIVVAVFIIFYNRIFSVTFDESFATATGTHAGVYNTLIAVISAVIIVLAMELVGSLLISALIVFPALSAMRVFTGFKSVVICSACISVTAATVGLILSLLFSTPTGATIVAVDMVLFLVFTAIGKLCKRA